MPGSISAMGSYYSMYRYGFPYGNNLSVRGTQKQNLQKADQADFSQTEKTASKTAPPQAASTPKTQPAVYSGGRLYLTSPAAQEQNGEGISTFSLLQGDPAELAVRMRIQYPEQAGAASAASENPEKLSGEKENVSEAENVGKIGEEEKCQTCENRKYQDGSDDMGVSFQTPTRIAPEAVASAVRGHEQEHVVREQAKAEREGRRVVSQNVTLHTGICPECGEVYISGGTTRTVTAAESEQTGTENFNTGSFAQSERRPFSAVA